MTKRFNVEEYQVSDLGITNMKQVRVYGQSSPNRRDGNFKFEVEDNMTIKEKLAFIDKMRDGIGSYMLNLIELWNEQSPDLPRTSNGNINNSSKKAWIKKLDTRDIILRSGISNYLMPYYMFGQKYMQLDLITRTTEYGYELSHTGSHIVNQWFHDLLVECQEEEYKYNLEHDEFELKVTELLELAKRGTFFKSRRLNMLIWNGRCRIEKDKITEAEITTWIFAYKSIIATIDQLAEELIPADVDYDKEDK